MADKQRLNIYVPKEIIDMVDTYAEKFGASRGVMISIMLQNYIDQQKILEMSTSVDLLMEQQTRAGVKR